MIDLKQNQQMTQHYTKEKKKGINILIYSSFKLDGWQASGESFRMLEYN